MNRSEAKYNNAANKMHIALFKLIEKKPFQDITVSEVCNMAGVCRSTFYSHYENTTELLQETHKKYMNDFFKNFNTNINDLDISNIKVEDFVTDKFIIPYLKFIKKNKRIHKIYINNLSTFDTNDFYKLLLDNLWIPACKEKGINDYTIVNYMSKYYLNGMTSIVNEWVNNNCEDDIFLICEIIILCVRPERN